MLRTTLDCAIAWHHRPEAAANPSKSITRYGLPPQGRLPGERLGNARTVLCRLEQKSLLRVATVPLTLPTGYEPGETQRLRWCEVRPNRLALIDAKTGASYVLLGEAARKLRDRLPRQDFRGLGVPGRSETDR